MTTVQAFCPSCGAQLAPGASFCGSCGKPVAGGAAAASSGSAKPGLGRILATAVLLLVAGLLIGSVTGQTLVAVAIAAVIAIAYIVVASRR